LLPEQGHACGERRNDGQPDQALSQGSWIHDDLLEKKNLE
jgi:hypothetical protein